MMENRNGLYRNLIVHPGETLKEVMEENNINQEELAIRTDVSAKHISEVVNGKKGISATFAKKLEYVFSNIPSSFWNNLQAIYDGEIANYKDINNILEEEYAIFNEVKDLYNYSVKEHIIEESEEKAFQIIDFRKMLNISNLSSTEDLIPTKTLYRVSKKQKIDKKVLYIWQRICEKICDNNKINNKFNIDILLENLPKIKNVMFKEAKDVENSLKDVFKKCGINFNIVKNFKGAPVQGFIQEKEGIINLCMTLRGKFADIFWFSLFHEIGHILNYDYDNKLFDFYDEKSIEEEKADSFARTFLIDDVDFGEFIKNNNFTIESVRDFSKKQNVPDFIVIGRIMKYKNDYTILSKYRKSYKWLEN